MEPVLQLTVRPQWDELDSARERAVTFLRGHAFGEATIQATEMVVCELTENATKYGSLSSNEGRVDLATRIAGDELVLRWSETGGPAIRKPPEGTGFGTVLSELSIVGQLGGHLAREWLSDGLAVTIRVPRENLRRRGS